MQILPLFKRYTNKPHVITVTINNWLPFLWRMRWNSILFLTNKNKTEPLHISTIWNMTKIYFVFRSTKGFILTRIINFGYDFIIIAGRCTDLLNNYSCSCYLGFEGRNCDVDIDYCESSPCVNGRILSDEMCYCLRGIKIGAKWIKIW